MLEEPNIDNEVIIHCMHNEFGLPAQAITFLPLGADLNTAVYRVTAKDGKNYFLKLRSGEFSQASVAVPKYLSDRGMKQVIPPLAARDGRLWAKRPPYRAILYPFVEGHHGYEEKMSAQLWIEFGAALKKFHTTDFPEEITRDIPREKFSPRWRDTVKTFLKRIEHETFDEPIAAQMAAFLQSKTRETFELVQRSERLAGNLRPQTLEFILCHADNHGWNLLISKSGELYIVDWDTLIFAPKERDLMFIGGALGDSGYSAQEEESLFYQGYGRTDINHTAMAYYRYERIVEDIGVYCEQIFLSTDGGDDRKQALEYLKSNYLPNGTIERARQLDKSNYQ